MILIKINDIKTLMKIMKIMISCHNCHYVLKLFLNFIFMIFFSFKNDVVYVNFFYSSFNLADDCFNTLNTNLCYSCKLNFELMLILLCNRLLQASV